MAGGRRQFCRQLEVGAARGTGPPRRADDRSMFPPIPSRAAFIRMLAEPPAWLGEAMEGLDAAELEARPFPGTWSLREMIAHVVEVDLGWSDILYRAVRPLRPQHGAYEPTWKARFDLRRADLDPLEPIAMMAENHAAMAEWIQRLSDADFLHPFPGVLWLVDAKLPVVVADSGRWGLYLHPYHHLAYIQRQRVALGRPLASLERFLQRCPGSDPQALWPPWVAPG